jgi:hypothetical protein
MILQKLLEEEEAKREELKKQILSIIFKLCEPAEPGKHAMTRRGWLQNAVYENLGFKGTCGNHFSRFITRLLAENGFRESWFEGHRVYYGLKPRA